MSDVQDEPAACAAISTAVARIMHDYTGRGQTEARTTIQDDVVTVTVPDAMLKAERSLVASGKTDLVLHTRRYFQQTMRDDLSAAVETLTQREVIAITLHSHLAPDFSVAIFVLAAEASGGAPEGDGGRAPDQFVRRRPPGLAAAIMARSARATPAGHERRFQPRPPLCVARIAQATASCVRAGALGRAAGARGAARVRRWHERRQGAREGGESSSAHLEKPRSAGLSRLCTAASDSLARASQLLWHHLARAGRRTRCPAMAETPSTGLVGRDHAELPPPDRRSDSASTMSGRLVHCAVSSGLSTRMP